MWFVYEVESYLEPVMNGLCDTLTARCEKEARINVPFGPNVKAWFAVGKDTAKTEAGYFVRVHGFCGLTDFRFRSGKNGFTFAVNGYKDPEHIFYQFISMIQFYRDNIGLECLDIDYIFDINGADSPPVTPYNYAAITGVDAAPLQKILHGKFSGVARREMHGRYGIIIYSDNASGKWFNKKLATLCQKQLESFTSGYFFENAVLFCVRKSCEQHIYFSVKETGLFYCTGDNSRDFLVRELRYLKEMLSISPAGNEAEMAEQKTGVTEGKGKKLFTAPEELAGIVKAMRDTFIKDCEKDKPVTVDAKRKMWFYVDKVPGDENEKDTLWVRGGIGNYEFRFSADETGAGFEPDDEKLDAENLFYLFIYMTADYRKQRGLSPLDTSLIDRLAEADSPPVSAENYGEIAPDEKTVKLAELIRGDFSLASVKECYGQLCFHVCSEQGQLKNMPLAYIPVYMKLLTAFKTAFSVKSVTLLAVRWSGKQRLFFIDDKNRVFCCKHDGSREFLYERFNFIVDLLGASPNTMTGKLSNMFGSPINIKELNDIFEGKVPPPPGWRVNTKR